ncbi:hypothetical protein ESCO_000575 [Escovopsis weberi]|uniref:Uncharacterized protein n=1 Tax=Escovopsis weberi TaxID=150374 RepID=A0A0M8MZ34_ESCWE|nr:hypothetical protein ESCO_000575 [Escovopsis weberi]
MPPANGKTNYKSYDAQARLVRAIVAAHPEVKWNYKEIVACYGSDMTEHALNHRFRRLRAQAVIIREGRKTGLDIKDMIADGDKLPSTQDAIDKHDIAKYFGQSTADGIHFQFRGIKKDASHLRQVESQGGDVASCLNLGSASGPSTGSPFSTPSKPTPSRSVGSRTGGGTGRKRARVSEIKRSSSDEEDLDGDEVPSWSDIEATPTKRPRGGALPGQKNGTPSRRAAAKASATIAEAAAALDASGSEEPPEVDAQTPTARRGRVKIGSPPAETGPGPVLADDAVQRAAPAYSVYDALGDGEI